MVALGSCQGSSAWAHAYGGISLFEIRGDCSSSTACSGKLGEIIAQVGGVCMACLPYANTPYDGATCGADQCCGRFGDDLRLVLVRVRAVKAKREPLSGVCTSSAQPGASLLLFRDISSLVRGGGDEIRA